MISKTPWQMSGPYKDENREYTEYQIYDINGEELVCSFIKGKHNARLIRAAPDLLEALKAAVLMGNLPPAIEFAAQKAIEDAQ